jgi:sortase (surface protein transpeptidase)
VTDRRAAAVAALVALLAAHAVLAASVLVPAPPSSTTVVALPVQPAAAPAGPQAPAPDVGELRLEIPGIGLDVPLGRTGTDVGGVLVPPEDPGEAAWFTGSARPGDPGPAVVVGHVGSRAGPGVFRRLVDLGPQDVVLVRRGGTTARFRVTDVRTTPKDAFPTAAVYGPVPGPELRLITCGGGFDATTRHYLDNVVVSAVLVP